MKKYIKMIKEQLGMNEWQIAFLLLISALLTFGMIMYSDMKITSEGSFAILKGHLWDFYDYNVNNRISPELVYFPTMYYIFALWNLPVFLFWEDTPFAKSPRRLTALLYWDKMLVLICFFVSIYLFYKICNVLFENEKNALLSTVAFVFTPYLFIAEIAFGTYDYLYMVFVLWALYIYLTNKTDKWWIPFSIIFGFSFTIKQLTIFIWLPLLLYREKKVLKIITNFIVAFALYFVEILLYHSSPYFLKEVLNSHFITFMTKMTFNNGLCNISIWGILFGLLCIFAYVIPYEENNTNSIWFAMTGPMILILTCHWTINWILLFIPFMILLICKKKNYKQLFLIDFAFGILFILMLFYQQTGYWGYAYYGEGMLDYSIFMRFRNETDLMLTVNLIDETKYTIMMGAMYSILIFFIYYLCPMRKQQNEDSTIALEKDSNNTFIAWRFIVGTIIYIIPIFVSVFH